MKKGHRIASMLLIGMCLLLVTSTLTFAAEDKAAAKALTALDDQWSKAAEARDVDRVASFYAEDAQVFPPNEPAVKGRAAAKEVWARYFAVPEFKISWKTTAAGADGNTGWTSGTYEDSFKGEDGKTVTEKGKYLCVWKKGADGKWKAIQDMWNSDSK